MILCSQILCRTAKNLSRNLSQIENSIGDGEICTPDLPSTSQTCYQLSCPDWIHILKVEFWNRKKVWKSIDQKSVKAKQTLSKVTCQKHAMLKTISLSLSLSDCHFKYFEPLPHFGTWKLSPTHNQNELK